MDRRPIKEHSGTFMPKVIICLIAVFLGFTSALWGPPLVTAIDFVFGLNLQRCGDA